MHHCITTHVQEILPPLGYSDLPGFLAKDGGLNSGIRKTIIKHFYRTHTHTRAGFMLAQVTAAALGK